MTLHPVEAELFHADGRTDLTKLMVFFFFLAILRKQLKMYEDITPLLHIPSGVWFLIKHRSKFHV